MLTYMTSDGDCPFEKWVRGLRDFRAVSQIRKRIYRASLGNLGDVKSVGGGVSEMRIPIGPGYRIYFGQDGGQIVILLCGGDKSSQTKDIKLAQDYWADTQTRRKNENR